MKLGVDQIWKVEVVMQVNDGAGASDKQRRDLLHEPLQQVLGVPEVLEEGRGVFVDVQGEEVQFGRPLCDEVDVFAEFHQPDRAHRLQANVMVVEQRHLQLAYGGLQVLGGPFLVGRPLAAERAPNNQRLAGLQVLAAKFL